MRAQSGGKWRDECGDLRIDPRLHVDTLHQLQSWLQLPREFPEHLVLFIAPGKLGITAGLTVIVTQILVSRKKPDLLVDNRTAEIGGEVTVSDPLVSAERSRPWNREKDGL